MLECPLWGFRAVKVSALCARFKRISRNLYAAAPPEATGGHEPEEDTAAYEEVQPAMFHTQTESLQENCRGYENRVCGSW